MDKMIAKLTILFENPFWIGIYEREENKNYEVCKIIFGAEPKDYEIYNFLTNNWIKLKFKLSIQKEEEPEKKHNPKRMQREIKKQLQITQIGTKAQQTLKLQQEQKKKERKELQKQCKFELLQQKKKEKKKGH